MFLFIVDIIYAALVGFMLGIAIMNKDLFRNPYIMVFEILTVIGFVVVPTFHYPYYSNEVILYYYEILYKDNFIVFISFFSLASIIAYWDNICSVFKIEKVKSFSKQKSGISTNLLGASSKNVEDIAIDLSTTILVKLAIYAFAPLNRMIISTIEHSVEVSPNQRKAIQKLIADHQNVHVNVPDTVRPFLRISMGQHAQAYALFQRLCKIAAAYEAYDQVTMERLIYVGQCLGLDQEGILTVLRNSGLTR